MIDMLATTMEKFGLISAFLFVGVITWFSYWLSATLTRGRIHGSAVAITLGLVLAYVGGVHTGGQQGFADGTLFGGLAMLGGAMFRDFAIIATAYGANLDAIRRAGAVGAVSLVLGVLVSFAVGAGVALAFGYQDPVSVTTIGAGAVPYIVGPVTGSALGASSDVIALSVAAGLGCLLAPSVLFFAVRGLLS